MSIRPIVSSVGRHKTNLHGFAWGLRAASAGRGSRTMGLAGDRPEHLALYAVGLHWANGQELIFWAGDSRLGPWL